jgi:hypothetical protein
MSTLLDQPALVVVTGGGYPLRKCARLPAFPLRADLSQFKSALPAVSDPRSLTQEDAFAKAMKDRRLASSFISALEGKAITAKSVSEPDFISDALKKRTLIATEALGKRFWAMEANHGAIAKENLFQRKLLITAEFFASLDRAVYPPGELPKFTFVSVNLNNPDAKELVERASKTCFHGKLFGKHVEWIDINLNLIHTIPEFNFGKRETKASAKPALKALLLGFLYADNPDLYLEMCRRFDDRKAFRLAMRLAEAAGK